MANQQQKTYSFKSVGQSFIDYIDETPGFSTDPPPLPIGIRTPIQLGGVYGLFQMHNDMLSQVSDNLRNLILTNHGERLGLYDFGANLKSLTTELTNSDIDAMAMSNIATSVAKYMPYVNLTGFSTFRNGPDGDQQVIQIGVTITFDVPTISDEGKQIRVILDTIG